MSAPPSAAHASGATPGVSRLPPRSSHSLQDNFGKPAEARLQFAVDAEGRTYLARQHAAYPHHLTRVFYLDRAAANAATVYLQSLSGGLTQGDNVALRVSATSSAVAHVTTQAATKVHSMDRGRAVQQIELEALEASHLEYIADPTICFPRSRLVARTSLRVAADASAIIGDSYLWHDPGGMDAMAFDSLISETAIARADGRLLALDRSRLTSPRGLAGNPALLGNYRAFGTVFAVGRGTFRDDVLTAVRTVLAGLPDVYAGVSRLPAQAGLWTRILATDGASLRTAMDRTWRECHRLMLGWSAERRRK